MFLGYALDSKAYRFGDLDNKTIIESWDAIFHENKFPFKLKVSVGNDLQVDDKPFSSRSRDGNKTEFESSRSKRVRVEKILVQIIMCLMFKVIVPF